MIKLNNIIKYRKIAGIEVNFNSENEITYYVVIVNIEKGRFIPEPIKEEIRNLKQLKELLPDTIPVCLTITGKGVIIKDYADNDENESIIKKILPFARENEFSVNTVQQEEKNSWVAIIRNEQLSNTITSFLDAGYTILDVFAGPLNIDIINTITDNSVSTYCTSGYEINFTGISIESIKKYEGEDHSYLISEEEINGKYLPALASSIKHLSVYDYTTTSKTEEVICSANDYKANIAIKIFAKSGVALLFLLLIINFLAYSNYNKKVNDINQEVFHNRSLLNKEKKLKKELAQKKQLLTKTGLDTKSMLAYYADQIAASKPKKMVFDEMLINPVEINKYKKNLVIQKNTILITGNSRSSLEINNWVSKLNNMEFVESAELFDLKYSGNKKITEFILELTVKD